MDNLPGDGRDRGKQEVEKDMGPISETRLKSMMANASEQGRITSYAELIDRYHDIYQFERECIEKGEDQKMVSAISLDRDALHKQIELFGKQLGKTKDEVLADLICREGSLEEYKLPEYGLITANTLKDSYTFSGFSSEDLRRGRFVRETGETQIIEGRKRDVVANGTESNPSSVEELERKAKLSIIGIEQKAEFRLTLRKGEVVVVFATSFTTDLLGEPVKIYPPGSIEKIRRLISFQETLASKQIPADLFYSGAGNYHETTRIYGIVISADRLDPEIVGLLRNGRDSFGIRREDMDSTVIKEDVDSWQEYADDFLERSARGNKVAMKKGSQQLKDIARKYFRL